MGYQPKKTKESNIVEYINRNKAKELEPHLYILILRKNTRKLQEYSNCFDKSGYAIKKFIDIKYKLSKCRPEVLVICWAMATDPERFKFVMTNLYYTYNLIDKTNSTTFKVNTNINGQTLMSINGKYFLTKDEIKCLLSIIKSLDVMRRNEYQLQEELKVLEEQQNVFEIYKNEKLSSR